MEGPVLAIDPGTRFHGLAISNPEATIGLPLATVDAIPKEAFLKRLGQEVEGKNVTRIVMGRPVSFSNTPLPMTNIAEQLAKEIKAHLSIPLFMFDERLTTKQVSENYSQKKRIDDRAAAIMLQAFLDANKT